MRAHNYSLPKKLLSILLCGLLLVGLLPTQTLAATVQEEGRFILVVETQDGLVIAPEYVTYKEGDSIGNALAQSDHVFTGLEDSWVTEIDGVVGNYHRGDEDGDYDFSKSASEIGFYRFSEDENSTLTVGLQQLMTAMAEYQTKDDDVKAAAKAAYDDAFSQFIGIDSDSAIILADALNKAVSDYEKTLAGTKYNVTFKDGSSNYKNASITVTNAYGREWKDDGDGVMSLPLGDYTFCIHKGDFWAEGSFKLSENTTITTALPNTSWLVLDEFRLSGSYGDEDNENSKFTDDEYTLGKWSDRKLTVAVSDTFNGTLYSYVEYDKATLADVPTLTAVYTSAKSGKEKKQDIPFESLNIGAREVLKQGSEGNTVIYRVSAVGEDGYTYSQDYTINFERIPSLKSIEVKDQNGVDQAATIPFDAGTTDYTYKVLDKVTSVTVTAQPLEEDYSVLINGKDATKGATVKLNSEGSTTVAVSVKAGDYLNTYNLEICPGEGKALSFVTENRDVTIEVVNKNGQVMPYEKFREGTTANRYQYALVPGETYSYVATTGEYYHIADDFKMEDVANSTIQVKVPTENWLKDLAFGTSKSSSKKGSLALDKAFTTDNHKYSVNFIDTEHIPYIWAKADSGIDIHALYEQKYASSLYHGKQADKELISGDTAGLQLNRFLMDENPVENAVTIRLSKESNGILYYQDYVVEFHRDLTLKNLSVKCEGATISLKQMKDGETTDKIGFATTVKEYNVTVSMEAKTLDLFLSRYTTKLCPGEEEVGYTVEVNGKDVTKEDKAVIEMTGNMETQDVIITVKNDKAPGGTCEYVLHVLKSPPVETTFKLSPEKAVLAVYETISGERVWPNENGNYSLCEDYKYEYALTCFGYIAKTGTLDVTRDEQNALVIKDGDAVYQVTETAAGGGALTVEWSLKEAPINDTIIKDMESEWSSFRGNSNNNAVTNADIPMSAEDGTLYWANKIGSGYSADAVGSPILVDGDLVTYAGSKIYRVDTVSGQIKATGDMDHKSAHATTPPAYANGMVFVALTDGTVQAFNARTLESLWIFKDPLGGQPVCPLTINDGYLYTGFWNSETGEANFVCLSITDEKPQNSQERKDASWYYTTIGGYYWAGAFASSDYVIVGTDDGTSVGTGQSSKLLMFEPYTGKLLDSIEGLNGDIRSSVVYDATTDAYYFTSKGGSFYSVKVVGTEDGWKFTDMWSVKLENGVGGTPMTTCSPSIYKGRAYVGVSGAGQFSPYSGHNISVIDLSRKKVAYTVPTQGYPQTSGLLTTAYEDKNGYAYVYFFDNMTPGKLRVLRDKPGQTKADYLTTEGSHQVAYGLFTPTGNQAEYAICSPIVDQYGTIYFKNDSAHMMAFGSAIEKIEVTKKPKRMVYEDGDTFDPKGMKVTATYANGKTRDITNYVTYDLETVTTEKKTVTISFPYVMYHNEEIGTSMTTGVTTTTPVTTLDLTIGQYVPPADEYLGDVNEDDEIDTTDASLIIAYYYDRVDLSEEQVKHADVNNDGEVDTIDANMVIAYYYDKIDSFQ